MIQIIVFSKDRPLQLHGYLTSLYAHWQGAPPRVDVLARVHGPYAAAYEQVRREFSDRVTLVVEESFKADLAGLLACNARHVCFGCDDAVFVAPVDAAVISDAFRDPDLLGISFRLGRTIRRGMFGGEMPQPEFLPLVAQNRHDGLEHDEWPVLCWDVRSAPGQTDWAYPWEVVGTVYDGRSVRDTVETLSFSSPNTLEEAGSRAWNRHTGRYLLRAWPTPRLVLPAVNVVQRDFPNGVAGGADLTPEYLLKLWEQGVRLDVDEFSRLRRRWDTWRLGTLWLRRAK